MPNFPVKNTYAELRRCEDECSKLRAKNIRLKKELASQQKKIDVMMQPRNILDIPYVLMGQWLQNRDQEKREARIEIEQLKQEIEQLKAKSELISIDMVLICPSCGMQHIDEPNLEIGWTNPPHKSHLCLNEDCKVIWRPADVPTNGVAKITTHGKNDSWLTGHNPIPKLLKKIEQLNFELKDLRDKYMDASSDLADIARVVNNPEGPGVAWAKDKLLEDVKTIFRQHKELCAKNKKLNGDIVQLKAELAGAIENPQSIVERLIELGRVEGELMKSDDDMYQEGEAVHEVVRGVIKQRNEAIEALRPYTETMHPLNISIEVRQRAYEIIQQYDRANKKKSN